MTTIVLDHQQGDEENRVRHGERQAKPIAGRRGLAHQDPEQNEQSGRDHEFDHAAGGARCAVAREELRPRVDIRHGVTVRICHA